MNHLILGIALSLVVTSTAQAGMFGLPKFKIEQSDDRFSDDGLTTFSGSWNRISKRSIAGGIHIDATGMFVEPIVITKTDGSVVAISLYIHNETQRQSAVGEPNSVGTPQRISFLTGEGQPIILTISRGDRKWADVSTYNKFQGVMTNVSETGFADITRDQYERIINSKSLAAKIEGSNRYVVYESKDISKNFILNLSMFYESHIKLK